MIRPSFLAVLGLALVVTGAVAYVVIDADGPPFGPPCEGYPCPTPPWYRDPGTVEGLFVVFGLAGLVLVAWTFASQQREDEP